MATNSVSIDSATHVAQNKWAADPEAAGFKPKKTIGEKIFDAVAYIGIGDIAVLIASIGTGYLLKHSNRTIPGSKLINEDGVSFSKAWTNMIDKVAGFSVFKNVSDRKTLNKRLDDALLTTALVIPGNLALLPIKWMESRKKAIVHKLNEKYGDPATENQLSDVELGDRKIERESSQSWGSLIKGRVIAWGIVFSSLTLVDKMSPTLIPNSMQKTGELFESAAEKTAQKFGTELSDKNRFRAQKFGEVGLIDFFATAAAVSILYVSSKIFARKSDDKQESTLKKPSQEVAVHIENRNNPHQIDETAPAQHQKLVVKREESHLAEAKKSAIESENLIHSAGY